MKAHRFIPDHACRERIQTAASTREVHTFYDTYFDSVDFSLAKRNIWLRQRNGIFILKKAVSSTQEQYSDDEQDITQQLDLSCSSPLQVLLSKQGIGKRFSFTNDRTVYTFDSVVVYVDMVYSLGSDLFEYHVGKVIGTDVFITEFCNKYQITLEEAAPKASFFLKTYHPDLTSCSN